MLGLAFSLSLILPSPTDVTSRHCLAGVARRGITVAYALRCESTTAGHLASHGSRCHARLHGSAQHLVSHRGFVQVVLATWSPLAITLGCPVTLARSQTRQKLLLAPQPPYCVIARPIRPQLLDGLQALASAQLIIILLIRGSFPPCLRHHCRSALALHGRQPRQLLRSDRFIACFRSPLLGASPASLRASANSALYGPLEPLRRLERRVRQVFVPYVKLPRVLSASLEAVSAIASSCSQFLKHAARPIVALCHQCVCQIRYR